MKTAGILAGCALAALLAGGVRAETFELRNGSALQASEITVEGNWVKIKVQDNGEVFVPKSDLTAEQLSRYYPDRSGTGLTFESRKVGENVEYVYYSDGRRTGRRVIDSDWKLVSAEGTLGDGVYREYYDSGAVKKEQTIINGAQTGPHKVYFPGGKVESEVYLFNNMRHGPSRIFDENGAVISEVNYAYGEKKAGDPAPADPPAAQAQAPAKRHNWLFVSGEIFSVTDADNRWRNSFNLERESLQSAFGSADGDFTAVPGFGGRAGLNLAFFSLAYSYVAGPSGRSSIDVSPAGGGGGTEKETFRTAYQRAMLEIKVPLVSVGTDSLSLGAGAGRAFARMRSERKLSGGLPALLGRSASDTESTQWSGFTYDFSLSAVSRGESGRCLEVGLRYSHFPTRPQDENWKKFSWNPLSAFLTFSF